LKKAFWHYKAPQFGGGGSEIYKSSVWRIPKKDRLQLWLQCAAAEAQGLISSRPFAEIWWFQAGSGASLWTRIAVTEQGFNARSPSVERLGCLFGSLLVCLFGSARGCFFSLVSGCLFGLVSGCLLSRLRIA